MCHAPVEGRRRCTREERRGRLEGRGGAAVHSWHNSWACRVIVSVALACVCLQAEFFADMDALGVRRPDVLTRVVEYMPEIISYVQVRDAGSRECIKAIIWWMSSGRNLFGVGV